MSICYVPKVVIGLLYRLSWESVHTSDMATAVLIAPTSENAVHSKFLFVPHNGLKGGGNKKAKPESQKYLTAARKHVMRGQFGFFSELALLLAIDSSFGRYRPLEAEREEESRGSGQRACNCPATAK